MEMPSRFIGFCVLAWFSGIAGSSAQDVVISEIMFNPDGDENAREYVEIFNRSNSPRSLEGFFISDGQAFDILVPAGGSGWLLGPGGYALIFDPDYFSGNDFYPVPEEAAVFTVPGATIGDRGLSNSVAETISLVSASGDTVSQVTYDLSCPPGHSWERVLPEGGDDSGNFLSSLCVGGTPGYENSVLPLPFDPALDAASLAVFPEPEYGGPAIISLSWLNRGREALSAVRIAVSGHGLGDASLLFPDTVPPGGRSPAETVGIDHLPGGLVTITAVIVEGNTAVTSNDTLRVTATVPVPDGTVIIDEVMSAPGDGEPEWIELLNTGEYPVSLTGLRIADGTGTRSDSLMAETVIGGNDFAILSHGPFPFDVPSSVPVVSVPSLPPLNNDGDAVFLLDWNGALSDSMRFGQAEKGVSFELISPGLRGTEKGWDLCVDPGGGTPGRMNSIHYPPSNVDESGKAASTALSIDPNPFSDLTEISYRLPFPLARVRLFVYDRRGRLVARIRDEEESGSEWRGSWSGRSDGEKLPSGPYILNLEALDKRSGKVHTERAVLVIGSGL